MRRRLLSGNKIRLTTSIPNNYIELEPTKYSSNYFYVYWDGELIKNSSLSYTKSGNISSISYGSTTGMITYNLNANSTENQTLSTITLTYEGQTVLVEIILYADYIVNTSYSEWYLNYMGGSRTSSTKLYTADLPYSSYKSRDTYQYKFYHDESSMPSTPTIKCDWTRYTLTTYKSGKITYSSPLSKYISTYVSEIDCAVRVVDNVPTKIDWEKNPLIAFKNTDGDEAVFIHNTSYSVTDNITNPNGFTKTERINYVGKLSKRSMSREHGSCTGFDDDFDVYLWVYMNTENNTLLVGVYNTFA